jgi:hypothetical protein
MLSLFGFDFASILKSHQIRGAAPRKYRESKTDHDTKLTLHNRVNFTSLLLKKYIKGFRKEVITLFNS